MAGSTAFYELKRSPAPTNEAACWSHGPWKFFVLADIAKSAPGKEQRAPLAVAAVRRIDAIFAIESEINGLGCAASRNPHNPHRAGGVRAPLAVVSGLFIRASSNDPLRRGPRSFPHEVCLIGTTNRREPD
jgi:hypothetical protein